MPDRQLTSSPVVTLATIVAPIIADRLKPWIRVTPATAAAMVAAGVSSVMICPLAAPWPYRIADQKCEDPVA
ncbi:hypothetical protein [Nonomuraea dietziae]|uniref:hypothetical protein n=1 Tax=Nonomuraea dietziae TaxID=65515 RepID=UPI00341ADC6F